MGYDAGGVPAARGYAADALFRDIIRCCGKPVTSLDEWICERD